jgi:hypothetical protein
VNVPSAGYFTFRPFGQYINEEVTPGILPPSTSVATNAVPSRGTTLYVDTSGTSRYTTISPTTDAVPVWFFTSLTSAIYIGVFGGRGAPGPVGTFMTLQRDAAATNGKSTFGADYIIGGGSTADAINSYESYPGTIPFVLSFKVNDVKGTAVRVGTEALSGTSFYYQFTLASGVLRYDLIVGGNTFNAGTPFTLTDSFAIITNGSTTSFLVNGINLITSTALTTSTTYSFSYISNATNSASISIPRTPTSYYTIYIV